MKNNKRASRRDNMTVKHWNTGASAVRFRDQADKQSKKAKAKLLREINKDTHIMTDKEVANSVDLEFSDFSDDGADIDELRDIIGEKKDK